MFILNLRIRRKCSEHTIDYKQCTVCGPSNNVNANPVPSIYRVIIQATSRVPIVDRVTTNGIPINQVPKSNINGDYDTQLRH